MSASFLRKFLLIGSTALLASCQLPHNARQWAVNAGRAVQDAVGGDKPETVRRAVSADGQALFKAPRSFNIPAGNDSLNNTARLLAGMPAAGLDALADVRSTNAWQSHQRKMDELWSNFGWRHEAPIEEWAAAEIPDLRRASGVFYPFSGPDFLFADTFFPQADTIVLCGLEPCEPLPAMTGLNEAEMGASLDGLVTSVSTAMQFSFFITKDMRRDLVSTRCRGVLPLILAFMARTGHRVDSVDLVRLDGNGVPALVQGAASNGVMIRAYGPNGVMKRVFYFKQDLSDESLSAGSPLLKFADSLGSPPAFLKSASYLMHEGGFSTIRNYVLTRCRAIVEDPSGVPYKNLAAGGHDLRLYGNYTGTLEMFSEHNQPDLIAAYREGRHNARPISFGVGYMYDPGRTCLMVARRR